MNKNKVWNIAWIFLAIGLMLSMIICTALILAPSADAFNATGTNYKASRTTQGVSGNTGTSTSWLSRFTGTANQAGNLNTLNTLFRLIVGWFGRLLANTAPGAPTVWINSTYGTNYTREDLNCFSTITDVNNETMNVSVIWYKNEAFELQIDYNNDYPNGTNFIATLGDRNTTIGSVWKCAIRIFDGSLYTEWANSTTLTITNYTANISIFDKEIDAETHPYSNDSRVYVNEWTTFYANFSSEITGSLSVQLRNTSDVGNAYDVVSIDLNGDGIRNEFITGEIANVSAYNSTGSMVWLATTESYIFEIALSDYNNDGNEEIFAADYTGYGRVYNKTGTEIFKTADLGDYVHTIAVGDLDLDGSNDDFVLGLRLTASDYGVAAYVHNGTNWTQTWNDTRPVSTTYEVDITHIQGEPTIVGCVDGSGGRAYLWYGNGTPKWNISSDLGDAYSLLFLDLNNDGKEDETVAGISGAMYAYLANGSLMWSTADPYVLVYDMAKIDLDNDGYKDDIVATDRYSVVWGFNNSLKQLWEFREPQELYQHYTPTDHYTIDTGDINDDGNEEVLIGGYSRTFWMLNRTGGVVGRYFYGDLPYSYVGDYISGAVGSNTGITILEDINNDGIQDTAIATAYGYIHTVQQALCTIRFDTGEEEYMNYNLTTKLYEYPRRFNETGYNKTSVEYKTYEWNITCQKNGYTTQFANSSINIYIKNTSLEAFDQEDDDENKAGWLNEQPVSINEMTYFFANYTDLEINQSVSEMGFIDQWAVDPGSELRALRVADLNNNGVKEYPVVGISEWLIAYYPNGSQYWNSSTPSGSIYEIDVGDLNNDGYFNDIVTVESGDYIRVFNRTGGQVWNSGDVGSDAVNVKIGDMDKDGLNDDFAATVNNGTGPAVSAYNTSNYTGWERMWTYVNSTYYNSYEEIAVGVLNSSYPYNYVSMSTYTTARPVILYSTNGTPLFDVNSDLGQIDSVAFADLNNDGNSNELLLGELGELRTYRDNGTALWTSTNPTGYTYDIQIADLTNDGTASEIVIADQYYVSAYNRTGTTLWTSPLQSYQLYHYSVWAEDVNNDGIIEVLAGGDGDVLFVLNGTNGVMLYDYNIKNEVLSTYSNIGTNLATQPSIRVSDPINRTKYVLFDGLQTGIYYVEVTPKCTINFNDSVTMRMDYNRTTGLFYYNRTFSSRGNYSWNITCISENHVTQNSAAKTIYINEAATQETPTAGAHHPYIGHTKDANLISYWQFEHGSNKTSIAIDSAGMNNGTLNGGVTFTDEGAIGSAYEFDGVDDYVNAGNLNASNITINSWIKRNSDISRQIIVAKHDDPHNDGDWLLDLYDGGGQDLLFTFVGNGTFRRAYTSEEPGIGVWSMITGTYDGSTIALYKDGILVNSSIYIGNITPTSENIWIGAREYSGANDYFNGSIDQVMIYNRSLSETEIYEMYLDGRINSSSTVSTDQDLGASAVNQTDYDNNALKNIFNWYRNETPIAILNMPFEGGSLTGTAGGTANGTKDYSGYGNNGTVYGAYWNQTGGVDGRGAYQFDGSNDWINTSLIGVTNFTISAWIYPKELVPATYHVIVGSSGIKFYTYEGMIYCYLYGPNFQAGKGITGIDQWHHVVCKYNGTHATVYVDGINGTAQTGSGSLIAHKFTAIGTRSTTTEFFNGSIDEVQIYNRSLTPEQVYSLYMLEHNRIVSNETQLNETWKCCITPNDGSADGPNYCSNNVTIVNGKPTTPVLLVPYNSTIITNRTPEYVWTNSVDADRETLTYDLIVSDESAFAAPVMNITGISEDTGTNTSYSNLTFDLELDKQYYWKVHAYDGTQYSEWSAVFNFTLESFLAVSLVVNSTNFGTMSPWDTNDTSDDNPNPLLMENIGNIRANITVTGTQLFELGGFPSEYYQFKIGLNETPSFDQTQSTMSYTNMTNVSSRIDTALLDWHNLNDTAEIDINVTVPAREPKGAKSSLITITVS